jgi:hypothetical protein
MRKTSATKRAASSPPVPARSSMMMFELFFDGGEARLERRQLVGSHGLEVGIGVGEHGFGVFDALLDGRILAELFDGGFEVAMLLGGGLKLLLVVDQGGVGELAAEFFVAGFELVEAVKHGVVSSCGSGQGMGRCWMSGEFREIARGRS